jgi:putative membrane protein
MIILFHILTKSTGMKVAIEKSNGILPLFMMLALFFTAACNNGSGNNADDDSTNLGDRIENKMNNMADSVQSRVAEYREDDFVTDVIKENKKEIAWLNAGIKYGNSSQLKSDARSMLKDHEKMGQDMMAYANQKSYTVGEVDTVNVVDINDKSGKDWDKAWADKMVDAHQDLVDKFEKFQDKAMDAELKNKVVNTLPTLRAHLDMARQLRDKLK